MTVKRGKFCLSKQVIPRRREWIGYEFWFSLLFYILLFDDFNNQFISSTLLTPYTRIRNAFSFGLEYHFCTSRRTATSPDGRHIVMVQYTSHLRIHSPSSRIRDVDGALKIAYGCCVVTNMSATISECSILLQVKPDPKCSMPMRIVKVLLYNLRTRQRSETK